MKAIVYKDRRSKDIISIQNVEVPIIKDDEILVKVHAATVTPSDLVGMGSLFAVRLFSKHARPKKAIPGVEFAGEVEAVGNNVIMFKKGDKVFGSSPCYGAWAEYICLPEDGVVVKLPSNMNYCEAACLCDGALTALHFLRNKAGVSKRQSVLINGASGAVGTYAVQIAAYLGAQVTGVCGPSNIELVKSLGADKVIDYTKGDFNRSGITYDIIFDAVGKSSYKNCMGSLGQNGIYMTTVPSPAAIADTLLTKTKAQKAIFAATGLSNRAGRIESLRLLKELAETKKLISVIDRCYTIEEGSEARRYVGKGHKKGNVLITL